MCVRVWARGALLTWLCQSPSVWPGRTTLRFPSFLVAEFPGAAVTKRWVPGCVAASPITPLPGRAQRCPWDPAVVAGGERVVGRQRPCAQDKCPCG